MGLRIKISSSVHKLFFMISKFMLFDRLDDFEYDEERDESATENSIPPSLAHIHSYLSTIDEANSPYGTEYGGSKQSNHYRPKITPNSFQIQRRCSKHCNPSPQPLFCCKHQHFSWNSRSGNCWSWSLGFREVLPPSLIRNRGTIRGNQISQIVD